MAEVERPFELVTERIVLRSPDPALAEAACNYLELNRAHFAASSPAGAGPFTIERCRENLRQEQRAFVEGSSVRLYLLERERADSPGDVTAEGVRTGNIIIGNVSFTNIVHGVFQACHLGYRIDQGHEGRGLMYEALTRCLEYAFEDLRLHRVMANYRPTNERSGRLLRRLGFVVEGYARDYLFLDGAWRDHVLTSLLNPRLGARERER